MKYFQILAIFGVLVRLTKTEDEGSNGSGKTMYNVGYVDGFPKFS